MSPQCDYFSVTLISPRFAHREDIAGRAARRQRRRGVPLARDTPVTSAFPSLSAHVEFVAMDFPSERVCVRRLLLPFQVNKCSVIYVSYM